MYLLESSESQRIVFVPVKLLFDAKLKLCNNSELDYKQYLYHAVTAITKLDEPYAFLKHSRYSLNEFFHIRPYILSV